MFTHYIKQYYNTLISPRLHNMAERLPRLYLLFILGVASLGYLFLLCFPTLFFISVKQLYTLYPDILKHPFQQSHIMWSILFAISTLVSFRIFTFRFPKIHGVRLREEKLPTLFKMLDTIQRDIKQLPLDRILVTDKFELDIIKTPVFGIPLFSNNTLVIGLPFLQSLSATHFRCALTRKLLQFSHFDNRMTNWIYQLRQVWQDYLNQYNKSCAFGEQPLYWFFSVYTPLFRSVSISAVQKDELSADRYTLEIINNDDVFKTIESIIIGKIFLKKQYWPKVRSMLKQDPDADILPYSKLEKIIKTAFLHSDVKQWLEQHYQQAEKPGNTTPSLKSRMHMLGRTKIKAPPIPNESAALVYLDNAYQEVVRRVDEKWLKKQRRRNKLQQYKNKTGGTINKLFNRPVKTAHYLDTDSVFN